MIPSMTGGGNDVVLQPGMIVFGSRGGRANEGRVQVDGLNTGASLNGGGVSGYRQDLENATEVAITTSGGLGEAEVGGIAMNIVPQTGGNRYTAHLYVTGYNENHRCGSGGAEPGQLQLRHERVEWWPDQARPAVVLHAVVLPRQWQRRLDVSQQERGRHHEMDV
jgi:hypothetical protein